MLGLDVKGHGVLVPRGVMAVRAAKPRAPGLKGRQGENPFPNFRLQAYTLHVILKQNLFTQPLATLVVSAFVEMPGIFRWTELVAHRTRVAIGLDMLCFNVLPESRLVLRGPETILTLPQISQLAHFQCDRRFQIYNSIGSITQTC